MRGASRAGSATPMARSEGYLVWRLSASALPRRKDTAMDLLIGVAWIVRPRPRTAVTAQVRADQDDLAAVCTANTSRRGARRRAVAGAVSRTLRAGR